MQRLRSRVMGVFFGSRSMNSAFATVDSCPVSHVGGAQAVAAPPVGPHAHTLEVLLKSISEGFYGIDRGGRCVFINRAGAETLGYTPQQLIGREMHALIHRYQADSDAAPREQHCPFYRAVVHGESCCIDSERLWRADGSSFPVEYSVSPIIEAGHTITGAVVTFRDISDRKQAEALQRRMHDELERRVEERTQELHQTLQELGRTTDRLRELSAHVENAPLVSSCRPTASTSPNTPAENKSE